MRWGSKGKANYLSKGDWGKKDVEEEVLLLLGIKRKDSKGEEESCGRWTEQETNLWEEGDDIYSWKKGSQVYNMPYCLPNSFKRGGRGAPCGRGDERPGSGTRGIK